VTTLRVVSLGLTPYGDALELQRSVAAAVIAGDIAEDVLLLVEHPPVVTIGRTSKEKHLLASPALLKERGIELFEVERGGDVTYHGPGQLVGYPIIDLKRHKQDLHWYLRQLEESIIKTLEMLGIGGERNPGFTGVWTRGPAGLSAPAEPLPEHSEVAESLTRGAPPRPQTAALRKIASIGVHARDWVTWHGFALNVSTDLKNFEVIVPCGIDGVTMTSIAREVGGIVVTVDDVGGAFVQAFCDVFKLEQSSWTAEQLRDQLRATTSG